MLIRVMGIIIHALFRGCNVITVVSASIDELTFGIYLAAVSSTRSGTFVLQ